METSTAKPRTLAEASRERRDIVSGEVIVAATGKGAFSVVGGGELYRPLMLHTADKKEGGERLAFCALGNSKPQRVTR